MTLAHLLRGADARLRLDLVRPAAPRLQGETAPPARLPPPLAASAVANALRLEIARHEPDARGAWFAERAPDRFAALAPDLAHAAEAALASALSDEGEAVELARAAERALRLARLEAVVRSGYVDARISEPEFGEDVAEVAAMLARVPWDELGEGLAPLPVFPSFAEALPDAEPDLLLDGAMLTVSASRAPRVEEDELRAAVLRVVLARAEWGAEAAAERVREAGVLFARHGVLWRVPVAPLVAHEAFPAVEAWFLARLPKARAAPAAAQPEARSALLPRWVKKRKRAGPQEQPKGKAKKKKSTARPPPPPPRAPRRDAPRASEGEEPRRKPSPDWRRGSAWRRDRGL